MRQPFLLAFGLHFLGVIKIGFLYRQARIENVGAPEIRGRILCHGASPSGFGWTPCVGPALAAILMVASGMGEVWRGGLLLAVYGISMTFLFVIAALFARPFLNWVGKHRSKLAHVEKVMGGMLVVLSRF